MSSDIGKSDDSSRAATPPIVAESGVHSQNTSRPIFSPLISRPRSLILGRPRSLASASPAKRPNTALKQPLPTMPSNWTVSDENLRDVPSFYPLDKSSRHIQDTPANIATRLSDCCRLLSVQARFDNDMATADLITEDHVEIHLTLWRGTCVSIDVDDNEEAGTKSEVKTTIVEAQRRNGCAVVYHKYSQNLLDAAQGYFCGETNNSKGPANQSQYPRVEIVKKPQEEEENSLLALEIAASLISKDRMDARRLGMESLCLLTDPTKTGIETALLASQVVLFGSVQDAGSTNLDDNEADCIPDELGIREAIISLVQFGRLGEYGDYDSDDEDAKLSTEETESNQLLHNLALAVLANALEVLKNHANKMGMTSSSNEHCARIESDSRQSASANANTFLEESKEMSNRELLKTLLNVLGNAESRPHDACLSAKCLKSLFRASKEAKRKAQDLNAKQIVMTALDVGRRTHIKLENETENVIKELQRVDDQEVQQHDDDNDDSDEESGSDGS